MLTFNPENQTYSKLIHIDEFPEMQKKMEQIAERVKNAPVFPVANYESEAELCIDCVDEIQKMIETENFQINTPINRRRATLFLVACYFCSTIEPIEYLLAQGSEINRTDIFGYNAIMSVILNENMTDEQKLVSVVESLKRAGYDPYDQIYGYVIMNEEAYITRQGNAREIIKTIKKDVLRKYLDGKYLEK